MQTQRGPNPEPNRCSFGPNVRNGKWARKLVIEYQYLSQKGALGDAFLERGATAVNLLAMIKLRIDSSFGKALFASRLRDRVWTIVDAVVGKHN